jgi:hypothetical protein
MQAFGSHFVGLKPFSMRLGVLIKLTAHSKLCECCPVAVSINLNPHDFDRVILGEVVDNPYGLIGSMTTERYNIKQQPRLTFDTSAYHCY